ncbi:hypothetical protein L6452_06090 [Arctium lappa]|uniref:Uncharacterized protein n=1 Tax=Arctium lappa TaxID=4217 RepID=A0ACB9EIN3_ARCLA|nr:hypothetical protein L6452_06090 [Arctium lappa]
MSDNCSGVNHLFMGMYKFAPDLIMLDAYETEAICSSLEDYNQQIEKLKEEMNDATHGANNIRNDIGALAQRYTVVDRDEECGGRLYTQKQLTLMSIEPKEGVNGGINGDDSFTSVAPVDKFLNWLHDGHIRSQLDDAIASECPFCGDLMI